MISYEKQKMLAIMKQYKEDEEYRARINSSDISELSLIEQIAIKDMIIASNGSEIIKNDLSNLYDDYNPINIETIEDVRITCANMAIGALLERALNEQNIDKYTHFNLREIKTRMKGDLYSKVDKPLIIEFIQHYNKSYPTYLPKKAKEYFEIYRGLIRNGVGEGTFISLAQTYNTNIYLGEISFGKDNFKKRK